MVPVAPSVPMWKLGYSVEKPPAYTLAEFIREGDDIEHWRELFTIQSFDAASWGAASPEESLNVMKILRERRCPGVTQWNVIETRSDSILYEWQARACEGWPEQHEVAKVLFGKYNRFWIHYVAKTYQLPSDTRSAWIKAFEQSKIVARCR